MSATVVDFAKAVEARKQAEEAGERNRKLAAMVDTIMSIRPRRLSLISAEAEPAASDLDT